MTTPPPYGSQPSQSGYGPPSGSGSQPTYGAPAGYGGQPQQFAPPVSFQPMRGPMRSEQSTTMATTALVCGLVAFVTAGIPVLGMLAIAPGIIALQRGIAVGIQRRAGRGRAITGAVFGGLGTLNAFWMPWVSLFVFFLPLFTYSS